MKPKLVHPVEVVIRNVDKSSMDYDPDFGVRKAGTEVKYGNPITIKAQVHYNRFKRIEGVITGFEERGEGHLTVFKEDAAGIEWNALICEIDGEEVEYYVSDIKPAGHYKRSTLRMIYFSSKEQGTSV